MKQNIVSAKAAVSQTFRQSLIVKLTQILEAFDNAPYRTSRRIGHCQANWMVISGSVTKGGERIVSLTQADYDFQEYVKQARIDFLLGNTDEIAFRNTLISLIGGLNTTEKTSN